MKFSRRQFRSSPSAFTLIELIFALTMVAIIIPTLVGTLTGAFKMKATAEAAVEPSRTAEQAFDWLRQDIGDAVPPSTAAVTMQGDFEGIQGTDDRGYEADDVTFFTVADSAMHNPLNSEIRQAELTVITAPNGDHVLVRKISRDMVTTTGSDLPESLNGAEANPDIEVVCRGVNGFSLRYFDGSVWQNTWDSTQLDNTLPAAIEVTITLNRDNGPARNEKDGKNCFRFTRIIPVPCSTAPFDTNVNTGNLQ